jgi:hypothetical protein
MTLKSSPKLSVLYDHRNLCTLSSPKLFVFYDYGNLRTLSTEP